MDRYTNYRENPLNWSLPLGRLFGIHIRMHLFFIAFIIIQLAREWLDAHGMVAAWAIIMGVMFLTVLLHEFGHCFGARAVGGDADHIMMWPLGGLAYVDAPRFPRPQFIVAAAGPAVNVLFCLLTATVVLVLGEATRIPWNPFRLFPVVPWVTHWRFADWMLVVWSVNYLLLLFNLLPVFPLDGGRILQTVLWKFQGLSKATEQATYVGMVGAILFGIIGLIESEGMLIFIACFGFLTCYQERQALKAGLIHQDNEFGYDFSRGFSAFEDDTPRRPSWLQRRRETRLANRAEKKRRQREILDRQIDAVLEKVHLEGIESLTRKERKILASGTEHKKQS